LEINLVVYQEQLQTLYLTMLTILFNLSVLLV